MIDVRALSAELELMEAHADGVSTRIDEMLAKAQRLKERITELRTEIGAARAEVTP